MKRIAILFACIASFALTTCDENQQVIGILRDISELDFLDVTAYADDIVLAGGASISPGLMDSVFYYTVYVVKDANRFVINAGFNSEGTVTGVCVNDGETGLEFDFIGDADKTIQLTAQLRHMERTDYHLTVVRGEPNAVARNIQIWVEPTIGAFFVGSGVIPKIKVTADLPPQGGVLSYQWYVNDQNTSRGGSLLSGATGNTYTMQRGETLMARTVYYYVEITNTIGGRAAVTESVPQAVTFLNKNDLSEKSIAMVNVPAGTVTAADVSWNSNRESRWYETDFPWSTPGFSMGQYPVTWELWKTIFDYAEAGGYKFANEGNQGGADWYQNNISTSTNMIHKPIGNKLHPVTAITWRDVIVWCNAYSEMNGLEPVYRNSDGEVLRNSRDSVDKLIDYEASTGYNGYRLPFYEEWFYAAYGADPNGNNPPWNNSWTGTNNLSETDKYLWGASPGKVAAGVYQTGVVGSMLPLVLPNGSKLYDMMGMVYQFVCTPFSEKEYQEYYAMGNDFTLFEQNVDWNARNLNGYVCLYNGAPDKTYLGDYGVSGSFQGFRLARDKE